MNRLAGVEDEFVEACAKRMADDLADAIEEVTAEWPGWSFVPSMARAAASDDDERTVFFFEAGVAVYYGDDGDVSTVDLPMEGRAAYVRRLRDAIEVRVTRLAAAWAFKNRDADGNVTIDGRSFATVESPELRAAAIRLARIESEDAGEPYDLFGGLETAVSWAEDVPVDGMVLEHVEDRTWRFVKDDRGGE